MNSIGDIHGIKIIANEAIPDGTIFVSPNDFLMFKDPEKWQEIQEKETKEMTDKLEVLFPTSQS